MKKVQTDVDGRRESLDGKCLAWFVPDCCVKKLFSHLTRLLKRNGRGWNDGTSMQVELCLI
jgi:hypothetical protein